MPTIKIDSPPVLEHIQQLCKYDWAQWLADGKPPLMLEVSLWQEKRRLRQNALYWKLITEISKQMPSHMDEEHHLPRIYDEFFKQMFLGIESSVVMGKPQDTTKAHKDLGVHEFSDYLTEVFVWASEHEIQMPLRWNEDYQETAK